MLHRNTKSNHRENPIICCFLDTQQGLIGIEPSFAAYDGWNGHLYPYPSNPSLRIDRRSAVTARNLRLKERPDTSCTGSLTWQSNLVVFFNLAAGTSYPAEPRNQEARGFLAAAFTAVAPFFMADSKAFSIVEAASLRPFPTLAKASGAGCAFCSASTLV